MPSSQNTPCYIGDLSTANSLTSPKYIFLTDLSVFSTSEYSSASNQFPPNRYSSTNGSTLLPTEYSTLPTASALLRRSLDFPDLDLKIPGEPIICKSKATGQYWPASIKMYAGLRSTGCKRNSNQAGSFTKYYLVQFCDKILLEVPRSFFLTSIDREFYTVKMGRLHTTEIPFKQIYPKILNVLPHLDLIVAGKAQEPTVKERNDRFLQAALIQNALLVGDVVYGNYSDDLLYQVAQILHERYFLQPTTFVEPLDPRIFQLSKKVKTSYISDIILPEAIILITVADIYKEALSLSITPRKYAMESLKEPDIVDYINCLRNNPPKLM
ncbi:hypothetical protein PGTUg99_034052 [Puccinia graminis f. sp. tritici]|uniref:Uncharacterized protein n=1 Tax=Puccinia graminis f. sp. tritici TaxID=56615 RepID=A0A5B0SIX1_PUCGR|nr:hypothetical protein PGTUg99_034052 [Puccinia graminis f. sp. tritici]